MNNAPMIVGPLGLTLQWWLGLFTGAMICFAVGRLTGHWN